MNILFIHQNFPGQFKFLAPALAHQGHQVAAMTMQKTDAKEWQGVKLVSLHRQHGEPRRTSIPGSRTLKPRRYAVKPAFVPPYS